MNHGAEITRLELSKAAELVGVGSVTLFRELRARNVLDGKNLPQQEYVDRGFFTISMRQHYLRGTLIKRYYAVTMITPAGMAFLSEIARDIRHGRTKVAAPDSHGNSSTARHCSPQESHQRCAAIMAILSGNACQADFPATPAR